MKYHAADKHEFLDHPTHYSASRPICPDKSLKYWA